MGRKKIKDFNKVKLKLGKLLKKQNETVIDLSKKKILLPKEKDKTKHDIPREPNAVLYEYIEKLNSSNESSHLSALSFIQSVFQPHAAQICADWNSRPFAYYNEKSLKSLNNLLGFNAKQNEIALQFGDLFEPIDRLCRHSISGQVPSEIAKLCSMIATVLSAHPRIVNGTVALDIIALSLLHRSEFWFRTAGVQILVDLTEARHRVLTSLLCAADCLSPFSKIDELQLLIDAKNHSAHRSTWTRLLIRHFESLYESKAFDSISSRKILLKAIMGYLRDIQYMLYISPFVSLDSSPKIKLHPFLSRIELSPLVSASSYASTDASLSSTWMLDSSNPVLDKLSNISAPKEGNGTSKKRSFQSQMKVQEEFDSRLVFYVLKEGQFLIDELVHNPSVDTIFGLIYVTRSLRAYLEMNPGHLRFADSESSSEILPSILRFTRQLCELLPPDCAGDTLIPDMTASSANLAGNVGGAGLSRKQLKRNSKRAAKLARRQASKQAGDVENTRSDQDSPQLSQLAGRLNRSEVLSHLLKQQILQLVWSLAADGGAYEFNSFPLMIKDFAQSLASFFLTAAAAGQEDSAVSALAFLNLASPALVWRWIHMIDFCLLYSARIRRLSSKQVTYSCAVNQIDERRRFDSLQCLTAPMVVTLAYIVHRWCNRQISTFSTSKTSPRAPRIVVRAAGILVAFLHQEFEKQRFRSPANIQSSRIDATWVKATMDTFNGIFLPPGMENPLETLVSDLCNVVERESVEIDVQKGRWIWAAACLNGLAEIRWPNVCERIESSSVLREAVISMKDWTRSPAVMEDPLMNLPSPWTATYPSVKSWKCLTTERIYAQDGSTG